MRTRPELHGNSAYAVEAKSLLFKFIGLVIAIILKFQYFGLKV